MYGLHTLPLKLDLLSKLDAFQMRGLRQILKLQPTYMNRDHTNEKVLETANVRLNQGRSDRSSGTEKKVIRVSEMIIKRAIQEMGEVIRAPRGDPRKLVTFADDDSLTLKLPFNNRVGRPRTHWGISVMQQVWNKLDLHTRTDILQNREFDVKNQHHIDRIIACAEANEF